MFFSAMLGLGRDAYSIYGLADLLSDGINITKPFKKMDVFTVLPYRHLQNCLPLRRLCYSSSGFSYTIPRMVFNGHVSESCEISLYIVKSFPRLLRYVPSRRENPL